MNLPDSSATNEIQTLLLDNNGEISISNGNSVQLPDSSSTNEIQTLSLNSGTISLTMNGGSVTLPDTSPTNELQLLSITSGSMSISNGNSVALPTTSHAIQAIDAVFGTPYGAPTYVPGLSSAFTVLNISNVFLLTTAVNFNFNPSVTTSLQFQVTDLNDNVYENIPFFNSVSNVPTLSTTSAITIMNYQPGNYQVKVRIATVPDSTVTAISGRRVSVSLLTF